MNKLNLTKLFNMQKLLDERIEKEHPRVEGEDRLSKKVLALLVEIGECANEYRSFKFWSNDQEPRMIKHQFERVVLKDGNLEPLKNPLLEEYVDCLHFLLSIGLERSHWVERLKIKSYKSNSIQNQFIGMYKRISEFDNLPSSKMYDRIFGWFVGLGELLGFTWEQIEDAYMSKNTENHRRQDDGY